MEKSEIKELLIKLINDGDLTIKLSAINEYDDVDATAVLKLYGEEITRETDTVYHTNEWGEDL